MSKHQKRFTHACKTQHSLGYAIGYGYSENEALRANLFHGETTFSRNDVRFYTIDEQGDLHEMQMTKEDILGLLDEVADQMESEIATLRRIS